MSHDLMHVRISITITSWLNALLNMPIYEPM